DGSQGSVIQGMNIYRSGWSSGSYKIVDINTDNITLKKNYIFALKNGAHTDGTGYSIYINGDRNDINIQQNWIFAQIADWSNSYNYNGYIYAIRFTGIPTNCIIKNNFIRSWKSHTYGYAYTIHMDVNDVAIDMDIYNNVMWGSITTYYTDQFNNILVSGTKDGGGDVMANNLCDGTQYPDMLNNQQNVDMSTVFVDYVLYIDNGYILASGSPATGAGISGGDCGVFGYQAGGVPYVLSGLPAIPAIYETNVVQTGTSAQVTIKAVSHNEHK
ncbi:MAG: hypothetical protein K8R58_13960, partial [Bacteroidales bacterium]|nr:hypothetical protein [Bacteroidales bacterium]